MKIIPEMTQIVGIKKKIRNKTAQKYKKESLKKITIDSETRTASVVLLTWDSFMRN